jgi:shikimate dehydrogenase
MSPDRYAVFGSPIAHSKSPRIHTLFAEQSRQNIEYLAKEVDAQAFTQAANDFFEQGGKGLNCTLPLKELAWSYANTRTERAERSKAVNTLVYLADGHIQGDNTDGQGLLADLLINHKLSLKNNRILILGAGGATRGIVEPLLKQSPASLVIANRTPVKAKIIANEFVDLGKISGCGFDDLSNDHFDLIINATSASLSNELPPLPDNILARSGSCYDLAYSNQPTAFVRWGQTQDAKVSVDGLGMLVEQAAEAFFIWRGVRPQTQPVIDLLNAERA